MKKTLTSLALTAALVLLGTVPSSTQTAVNTTTLAAAITSTSQTSITLTATTGMAAGDIIFFPGWPFEGMQVVSVGSGGVVRVIRGVMGTNLLHRNGKTVWYDPPGTAGALGGGMQPTAPKTDETCTRTSQVQSPWIDTSTGIVWRCSGALEPNANRWRGTVDTILFFDSLGNVSVP